ncbi:PAS domain S-box protein [Burkholderia sp. BKH01]|uniref:PAS domain-containing sensor histidine kinase n=1 Tax=Burkholderia sp. BKH01 TaxID=2769262 RepID=UPI00295B5683|nr:PAS domain S-box protein [Burkholderia sp. BKH01]
MDVLTATCMVLLFGGQVWFFRKARRLAISEHLAKAAVNITADAILATDNQDHIVLFNCAAERLFGRSAPSVMGTDITALMPEYRSVCRGQTGSGTRETDRIAPDVSSLKALYPDGAAFFVDATVSKTIVGRKTFRTIVVRDVSEQRSLYEASSDSEAHYRELVELSPVATWLSRDGTIVYVNPACVALLGATESAEVIGSPSSDWLDPDGRVGVRRQVSGALHAPGMATRPTSGRVTRVDGLARDVEVLATAFAQARPASILVTLLDVTLHNTTERELRESRHALRELARALQIAREAERTNLARQLHDELAQQLNVVKMEVAALNAGRNPQPSRDAFANPDGHRIGAQLDDLVDRVRRITADLRPPMLDDLGLVATLEWLAQDLRSRYGLRIDTNLRETGIDTAASCVLYRIARDALERARLHASNSRISLHLLESGGFVRLTVREDDFIDDELANGLPPAMLFAIREQAAMVGGDVEWKALRAGGQELVVHLSLLGRRSDHP